VNFLRRRPHGRDAESLLRRRPREGGTSGRRILFPFIGSTISHATLDATLRLARAQDAVLVPVYVATVPRHLSLDSPAPLSESEAAVPLLELIEQRATHEGVRVDSRIERGRTHRHALTALLENEGYDALAVPAKTSTTDGFDPSDIAWLLENAPGEVLVLRPEPATAPGPPAAAT
jgi:nucleotide-binding universal stress UspA family protein